ncbi:MAG: LiaF transmembrane domain-containing protein [Parabacteroides sp.]
MELMENKEEKSNAQRPSAGAHFVAFVLIVGGITYLLRNLGFIQSEWVDQFISWQSLIILAGVCSILQQRYIGGVILILLGGYFLFPEWNAFISAQWHTYWPLLFVAMGLLILFRRKDRQEHNAPVANPNANTQTDVNDGYVYCDTSFTSVQQVVLDKVFKGADISILMSNIILDLGKTTLEKEETIIKVHSVCANVIIHVPADWVVRTDLMLFLAGNKDLRTRIEDPSGKTHTLVIKGNLLLSGLEIRN